MNGEIKYTFMIGVGEVNNENIIKFSNKQMDSRKGKFRILQLGVRVGERSHAKTLRRKEEIKLGDFAS